MVVAALFWSSVGDARPVRIQHDSAQLEFKYEWPAEAAAIPALDARIRADMNNALAEARANAADDWTAAHDEKRDFIQQSYSASWKILGQSSRLLSLEEAEEAFTGGAHPNHDFKALIWDRRLEHAVSVDALLLHARSLPALTRVAYCHALNIERSKRRGGEKFGGEFDECPKYSDLAIAPADANGNHRFDTIEFVAPPYIAGPYVEGEYLIDLPVTSQLIAAIRPEYRPFFERQRQ